MTDTDYTNPTTIDVGEVMAEIDNAYRMRHHTWTDRLSWPNVTVKAMSDEIAKQRAEFAESCQATLDQRQRAEAAEAEVERLQALARAVLDAWDSGPLPNMPWEVKDAIAKLRATSPTPTEPRQPRRDGLNEIA